MTKGALIKYVAEVAEITQVEARLAVDAVRDSLVAVVDQDGRVALDGLGIFYKVLRAARKMRNPQSGESMDMPAVYTVKFRPAVALKEQVNS